MAHFTNAADIITAAIEIERRGFTFYEQAAACAEQKEDKDFFLLLAKEEKRHEKFFSNMLVRIGGLELPAGSCTGEYFEYVDLLLNTHCLFLADKQEALLADPFREAMNFEKDTILFFSAMRRLIASAEASHIDACIEEEQRHLLLIAEHVKARTMAAGK